MAAYRLPGFDRMRTFYGESGQLLAGGYCKFYQAGTTTPQSVYGEKALTTNNGSTIDLDASGRLIHEVWADVANSFFVEVYDADDVKQGEADNVEVPGGAPQVIPVPGPDEFLSGDGTNFLVVDLSARLVPDPTGHSNQVLSTDGTDLTWIAKPADGADGANGVSDLAAVGLDGKTIRSGSATGTSAGGRTQTVSVVYDSALGASADFIGIEITSASLSSGTNNPSHRITTSSTTGFTVLFVMGEVDDSQSSYNFNAGVAFNYWAIGDAP